MTRRVWSAGRLLLLVGALAATYGVFFLAAMGVATRARNVQVPDVVGHTVQEATDLLSKSGLALKVDPAKRPDAKMPADHVLTQEPGAGSVLRRERAVRVHLSDGQREPVVPSVVGQVEREADITLTQARVQITERAEIHTADYPPGTIVSQNPPALSHATGVAILINRGESTTGYVMPDLIGMLGGRAQTILQRLGFRVAILGDVPYPGLPPGVIVRQTPQAGFRIAQTETISLEISR